MSSKLQCTNNSLDILLIQQIIETLNIPKVLMHKRSREELPHVRGQGQKLEGPHARRVAAKRSYPTSKVRGSGGEKLTHVQGKVRQLQFAGAAMKRYSTSKVIEPK